MKVTDVPIRGASSLLTYKLISSRVAVWPIVLGLERAGSFGRNFSSINANLYQEDPTPVTPDISYG